MPSEPVTIDEIIADLDGLWNASNVVKPSLITVNSANQPLRFDLNVGDHVIGRTGNPAFEEEPIGNWKYGNRTYNISLELWTLSGRQRLYDLMREIRRICHDRKHALTDFQRQQFVSFSEEVSEQVNMWTGSIDIKLENNAVLLET